MVALVVVGFAAATAHGRPVPDIGFRQTGHWIYDHTLRAAFHVDGGTKQVDAKVGVFDAEVGAQTVQGPTSGYVLDRAKVIVFGKSTLTVDATVPVGIPETPVAVETPGGPYAVYQAAGTLVRFGVPPLTLRLGTPVSDPVATDNGDLWLERTGTGALCTLPRGLDRVECPAQVPAGHHGALTAFGDRAAYVDTTDDSVRPVGGSGLQPGVPLHVDLTASARISAHPVGGRLAVVEPERGALILADAPGLGSDRAAAAPVTVPLGRGRFGTPVAAEGAVAVLDEATNQLLTFDPQGRKLAEATVPGSGGRQPRLSRGEDGRIYVDDPAGTRTVVVDHDGSLTNVQVGRSAPPTGRPRTPKPVPPKAPHRTAPAPAGPPATVVPTAPGAPPSVDARPGNASARVTWGAASGNGAPVLDYHISWREVAGAGPGGSATVAGNRLTTTVTGLRNGATYVVTVAARNKVGTGPGTDSPPVTPSSDTPGAPGAVTARAAPDGSVVLTWATADGQGHRIVSYQATATGNDGSSVPLGTVPGTQLTVAAGRLVLGVTYTATVTATNELGVAGDASPPSGPVTPYQPAGAPTGLASTVGDATITLTWAPPPLNGGELVAYVVAGSPGLAEQRVTGTTATFTGVTNGQRYDLQVHAVTREMNTAGSTVDGAPATTQATPGTTATVSIAGAGLSGDRQVTVSVVVDPHGSGPVTCRLVFNGAERWSGGCGTQNIVVGGLDYATDYDIYAVAVNAFGTSGASNHFVVRTNNPPPSIAVSKGAAYSGQACNTASCARIHVALRNFAAGTRYTVTCHSDNTATGPLNYSYTVQTDGAGNSDSEVCFFGYPGKNVWATAGGVSSPAMTW